MKRIKMFCSTLILSMLLGVVPSFAFYTDVALPVDYADSAYRLSDLGIISGYTDGTFRPFDHVTRAEFAKMIVCVMDRQEIAEGRSSYSSLFPDVADGSWAVPYINYVAQYGVIKGYADGAFGPDRSITYAEASAVMLRLLGYYEDSLGYDWADNYVKKANSFGWNQGMNIGKNDILTRAVMVMLVDDALFEEVNPEFVTESSATTTSNISETNSGGLKNTVSQSYTRNLTEGMCLLEAYGYTVEEDIIVMSTPSDNSGLDWNEVSILEDTGSNDGTVYVSDITLKDYSSGTVFSHVVVDTDNNHILAGKKFDNDWASDRAMKELGYTVLSGCHIISSSSYDMTLAAGQVRTSKGEYTTKTADILSAVGEYGTVVLNKDREIISYFTSEADYAEIVITDVDGSKVEYIEDNVIKDLELDGDFPIYIDYGSKRSYSSAVKELSGNSLLTLYSSNGGQSYDYGLVESNSGYTVYNDCFVAATKAEDSSLSTGQVKTSQGTFKLAKSDMITKGGTLGTMVLDKNSKVYAFAPTQLSSLSVTINRISGDQIEYIGANGVKGTLTPDSNFVTYVDYSKSSYLTSKQNFSAGTDITLYGENYGDWEFLVIDSSETVKPVLAAKDYTEASDSMEGITINHNNLVVYRNGQTAKLSDIQANDVVYYNTKTNIMDVYTKKVTGIYYDAKPSKAYVTSITVGGKEYSLATIDATSRLDASVGAYSIGDRITLLLGKNDEVAFVNELSGFNYMDYGVVMSVGSRIKEVGDDSGKSEYIASVFMPDGNTYDYVTDKKYSEYIGDLVKLSSTDGVMTLSMVSITNSFSGTIDKANRTIAGHELASGMAIIQRITDNNGNITSAEILDFDTMPASQITVHQAINMISANDFGDIGLLYVENLTDSGYDYGILTGKKSTEMGDSLSVTYSIYCNGQTNTYTTNYSQNTQYGPVAFKVIDGVLQDVKVLYNYANAVSYSAIDETRIKMGTTVYNVDPNVRIFSKTNDNKYIEQSFTDLKNAKTSSVVIYSNVSKNNSGNIKIIVYTEK